ncbi:MAG: flagellar biosynthesis anti-sigma factor FlgM [Tissierellia bacterium]|nr:flagellar biosynthesis anti-sigma factor FlgM [Tissierellia bacterium]
MKINKTNKIFQIYENMKNGRLNSNKNVSKKDEFKASEKALDYQFAINKLKEVPEIRKERVERIKAQVQSGNYNVEGKKIAEKIIEGLHFDKRV